MRDPANPAIGDDVSPPKSKHAAAEGPWSAEIAEIERRREIAAAHGGAEQVARHHAAGRLTIRERIHRLLDAGSFEEIGGLAAAVDRDEGGAATRITPANSVLGTGRVDSRDVVVHGEDATIRGGSSDGGGSAKGYYADELAYQLRVPLVRLIEGVGGSVKTNRRFHTERPLAPGSEPPRWIDLLGMTPVVSAAMGAVAGLPAARMAMAHFSIMVRDAVIFAGGPPLVERALGRRITKEALGDFRIHAEVSGLVDNVAEDEADCLRQIRRFLSYLPTNVWEQPPWRPSDDDPARRDQALASIIPRDRRQPYDTRRVVAAVVDRGSFFELQPGFGSSLVTGLARADGHPIGVVANDPRHLGGAMDATAADKMTRFVDLCDTFHLPILSLEDEPGYMIGPEAEQAGTLRSGVRALAAVKQTTVPWITFIVRRAYGVAAAVHLGVTGLLYAWPSAEWGSIPIEGGVAAAYRREIAAAPDPERRRRELEASHEGDRSPFPRAEAFGLHDLVDPRQTRPLTVSFTRRAYQTLKSTLGVKRRTLRP